MYDSEEQKEIDAWDAQVEKWCRTKGTYHGVHPDDGRNFIIEIDCYRADDSIDGFVGWWHDDYGITTHADTPYEVFLDLP